MEQKNRITIDPQTKAEIERVLNAGYRVELLLTDHNLRIIKIEREQVKTVSRS